MPAWSVALLAMLATVGLVAALVGALSLTWFGLGPIGSAATSSRNSAGGSSAIPFASSVTPVSFAEVATLIAYARPSSSQTPEALPVYLTEVTNTPVPTHLPVTATWAAQMTAVAHEKATATALARPRSCYETMPGRVCIWPSPTSTMPPPLPTLPPCETPIVGELCVLYGAPRGAGATPLPVILTMATPPAMPLHQGGH